MKDTNVLITSKQFADAYTRAFMPDIADVQQPKELKAKSPRKK